MTYRFLRKSNGRTTGILALGFTAAVLIEVSDTCISSWRPAAGHEQLAVQAMPPDVSLRIEQKRADEQRITIRQANLFHARFIETVMSELPPKATLLYAGRLRTDDGARYGFRKKASVGNPLGWHVQGEGIVTFSFWISTQRTTDTVVETEVEMQKLFVNVNHVNANRGLDTPLPELGNLTVRQTLAKLNKPWPITLEDLKEQAKNKER